MQSEIVILVGTILLWIIRGEYIKRKSMLEREISDAKKDDYLLKQLRSLTHELQLKTVELERVRRERDTYYRVAFRLYRQLRRETSTSSSDFQARLCKFEMASGDFRTQIDNLRKLCVAQNGVINIKNAEIAQLNKKLTTVERKLAKFDQLLAQVSRSA